MELGFLGGGQEVGRSCVALSTDQTTVFLDCGLKMHKSPELPLLGTSKQPQAVILSHPHLDHCGAIPLLFKHGAPTVYCATPSIAVSEVLFNDTLKIALQEKKSAPFSQGDVKKALNRFSALGYSHEFSLPGLNFSLLDAGHIIGSAQISIETENKRVVYSGDFKLRETRMHGGAEVPKSVDVLIMECTYGNKAQPPRKQLEEAFFEEAQDVIDEGGVALIPCFAIGRTQEIISLLSEKNFRGDIYIEGMGATINSIYSNYASYLKNGKGFKAALKRVRQVVNKSERKRALEGSVIIATAGMLDGGPVLSYLQAIERNETHAKLFLTGFQAPGTNGWRLLNGEPLWIKTNRGTISKRFSIPFKHFEFSAHADETELIEYVEKTNAEKVFCVHGDDAPGFVAKLKEEGFDAYSPKNGERIKV